MENARESAGWAERAVNKVAEVIISKLVEAEQADIWVTTTLPQIMRGEVDAIAIHLQEFLVQKDLRISAFQLQIGQVNILPKLAIKGTIQLVQPTTGELTITLHEDQLSGFLREQLIQDSPPSSSPSSNVLQTYAIRKISTAFSAEQQLQIAVDWAAIPGELVQSSVLLTTPDIASDGQAVHLIVCSVTGADVPMELRTIILDEINSVLSLHAFQKQGTSFQIQRIDITSAKLTLHAAATIHQFPSR